MIKKVLSRSILLCLILIAPIFLSPAAFSQTARNDSGSKEVVRAKPSRDVTRVMPPAKETTSKEAKEPVKEAPTETAAETPRETPKAEPPAQPLSASAVLTPREAAPTPVSPPAEIFPPAVPNPTATAAGAAVAGRAELSTEKAGTKADEVAQTIAQEAGARSSGEETTDQSASQAASETMGPPYELVGTTRPSLSSPGEGDLACDPRVASSPPKVRTKDDQKSAILFVTPQEANLPLVSSATLGARMAREELGGEFSLLEAKEEICPSLSQAPNRGRVRMVVGHLFEDNLLANAPYYENARVPVLLPFLDNWETPKLGDNYFQLLASVPAQARALARDILLTKIKPPVIYILEGKEPTLKLLADSFYDALYTPDNENSKPRVSPLAKRVKVERVVLDDMAKVPEFLSTVNKNQKYFVLLALTSRDAIRLVPYLMESNLKSSVFYGATSLANRDVGSAYASQGFVIQFCVPVNLADSKNERLQDFVLRYRQRYKTDPTWSSVMAYDAVSLATKALSRENWADYLRSPEGSVGLSGDYNFKSDLRPVAVLKVDNKQNLKNISYLP
jgi:ABC-type branched-subunit amino acid transport system substrate-binding protein